MYIFPLFLGATSLSGFRVNSLIFCFLFEYDRKPRRIEITLPQVTDTREYVFDKDKYTEYKNSKYPGVVQFASTLRDTNLEGFCSLAALDSEHKLLYQVCAQLCRNVGQGPKY